ncbi:MAG: small subunit ribosomal protein [Actinomycetota bacterium]|jgi:small subunit ribosomal protein S4|nr:small subunit ribosomal protein [Actinomycetota bacterium]MEA2487346.1 small subunit ribosomal protein [Actinomycetota bacterium]
MARYLGPVCKLCRRERTKLFLKGTRCESPKCPIEKGRPPPGEQGRGRVRESEYLLQLREKQKAKRFYGILEKQFRRYYEEAAQSKGVTGEELMRICETRLDNVVYRAGFAMNRPMARQLVSHGHFEVNGKKVNIPSFRVKTGDTVTVRNRSKSLGRIVENTSYAEGRVIPDWLSSSLSDLSVSVVALPERSQMEVPVQEQLIVEYYSK